MIMKKLLLFTVLTAFSAFLTNAQTWDFNDSDDGWDPSGFEITTGTTFLTLTCKEGATNPALKQANAGVDASASHIVAVTLKNISSDGPTYLRVSFPKDGGGRVYKNLDITNGDTEFKTYYFDMTNSNWTGTVDDLQLNFKNAGNTDFIAAGNEKIELDKIELLSEIPTRISKHASYKLSVGPNPSNGRFRINSEKPIAGYTVFNTAGQVVKQVNSLNGISANVDLSGGAKGLYYIKVNYESGVSKVIKAIVR